MYLAVSEVVHAPLRVATRAPLAREVHKRFIFCTCAALLLSVQRSAQRCVVAFSRKLSKNQAAVELIQQWAKVSREG